MSKKKLILIYLICFVMVAVSAYPLVETFIVSKAQQENEIALFEERFQDVGYTEEEINELIALEEPGNYSVSLGKVNIIGVLYVPKIGLKLPIYDNTNPRAIENGAGLIEGTGDIYDRGIANPVLTAHNGMVNKNLFMNLNKIKVGDEFFTRTAFETSQYRVVGEETKLPEDEIDYLINNFQDNTYLTLRTCVPTGINSHRLLITGVFEGNVQDKVVDKISSEVSFFDSISFIHYFCAGGILFALVILIAATKRYKKEEKNLIRKKSNN